MLQQLTEAHLFPASVRDGDVILDVAHGVGMARLQYLLRQISQLVHVYLLNSQLLLKPLHRSRRQSINEPKFH